MLTLLRRRVVDEEGIEDSNLQWRSNGWVFHASLQDHSSFERHRLLYATLQNPPSWYLFSRRWSWVSGMLPLYSHLQEMYRSLWLLRGSFCCCNSIVRARFRVRVRVSFQQTSIILQQRFPCFAQDDINSKSYNMQKGWCSNRQIKVVVKGASITDWDLQHALSSMFLLSLAPWGKNNRGITSLAKVLHPQ